MLRNLHMKSQLFKNTFYQLQYINASFIHFKYYCLPILIRKKFSYKDSDYYIRSSSSGVVDRSGYFSQTYLHASDSLKKHTQCPWEKSYIAGTFFLRK